MSVRTITIRTAGGLTNAIAQQVSSTARQYEAVVQLERRDGLRVYVGSPGLVQRLRLQEGDQVTIKAEGIDEQRAIEALTHILGAG